MAKQSKLDQLAQVDLDMTPMIDVIFNLLIFFMLVNRMVQDERAELAIPIAQEAKEVKIQDVNRLIINIEKDGKINIGGEIIPKENLVARIAKEAKAAPQEQGLSTRRVLVRGDVNSPYKYIQNVLWICAQNKIYKVSFAARIP